MASFSSLLQFFYMFAAVQSNGIKSLDLEKKSFGNLFFKKGRKAADFGITFF